MLSTGTLGSFPPSSWTTSSYEDNDLSKAREAPDTGTAHVAGRTKTCTLPPPSTISALVQSEVPDGAPWLLDSTIPWQVTILPPKPATVRILDPEVHTVLDSQFHHEFQLTLPQVNLELLSLCQIWSAARVSRCPPRRSYCSRKRCADRRSSHG